MIKIILMDKSDRSRKIYLRQHNKKRIVGFEKFELRSISKYQKQQILHKRKRVYYRSILSRSDCENQIFPFGLKYTGYAI
jgi:hypothetical protein